MLAGRSSWPSTSARDRRGRAPRSSGRSTSAARCRWRTACTSSAAEFLTTALSKVGQELMLDYMANTEADRRAAALPARASSTRCSRRARTRGAGATQRSGEPLMSEPHRHPPRRLLRLRRRHLRGLALPARRRHQPAGRRSSATASAPPARCAWTPSPSASPQAGIAAFAFTYRHFGDCGGQPRQLLSIKRQLADWDAAIAHVKGRADVDGTRVAVWGSSFGGGHAITVASRHPELRAAVSQCPFTDGLASARALGPVGTMRLLPTVARDLARHGPRRGPGHSSRWPARPERRR